MATFPHPWVQSIHGGAEVSRLFQHCDRRARHIAVAYLTASGQSPVSQRQASTAIPPVFEGTYLQQSLHSMSIQQEALPRRGTALREAFHRALKAALQCPPLEVWPKAEVHSTSLLLQHLRYRCSACRRLLQTFPLFRTATLWGYMSCMPRSVAGMHEGSMRHSGQHRSYCTLTQVGIATGAAPCKSQLRGEQHDPVRGVIGLASSFWGHDRCCKDVVETPA